jgi:hypothetical protein
MNQAQIDAGFDLVSELRLRARLHDARNPDFWRALNPQLTISDHPFASAPAAVVVDPDAVTRAILQLDEDGYCQAPPIVPPERILPLRLGIERIVAAGFPSTLACVYDEFYQAFGGLDALFAPLLGDRYKLGLSGLSAFSVPPGDRAYRRWGALSPHRDSLGPDPEVLARRLPSILNVWIALTDVTPRDSCIYVVPAGSDPHYYSEDRDVRQELIRLQDIRALPAPAGSLIAWSTHLAHWGSSSSRFAGGPRIAIAMYFHRRDGSSHPRVVEFGQRMPFDDRLAWIDDSLRLRGTLGNIPGGA